MPGSAFNPAGFGRRAAAIAAGAALAAGAAGVGWWQASLSTSASCQITAPAAGTVSGSAVTIAATCGSTAVSVQFEVDGASVGVDGGLPFTDSWDSTTVVDGAHSITVIAFDANGNQLTSSAVSVTTSNGISGSGTAHLWISAAGNDSTCARNASAVSYATALAASPTNVCAAGPKAYQLASLGDTVLVEGAFTVSSQWFFDKTMTKTVTSGTCNYNYGGSANLTNCVTIKPDTGQSLVFNCSTGGCGGSGTAQGVQIKICVSGLSIQNATVNETDWTDTFGGLNKQSSNNAMGIGSSDSTCGTSLAPHDDYFANMTFGGQVGVVGGANNVWIVNSIAASTKNLPWQFAGTGNNGAITAVHDSGVVGTTFKGYNFTANNGRHMECVHVDGSESNETWAGDQFQQCPVESLFFETETGSQTGNLIENTTFDPGSGGGPFKFDCRQPGCVESNNTVRFTSSTAAWQFVCEASSGSCNMDNNVFYGNVRLGCVTVTTLGATIVGTGLVDQGYNVLTGAQTGSCTAGTSAYSATVTYLAAGSPSYDLGLSGAQTATNFVPNSVTWPLSGTYRNGTARSGATTNAGAN